MSEFRHLAEPQALDATHGDMATHIGTCQTCGRTDAALKANWHRRAEDWHFTCVNQFACAEAWNQRRRY